MSGSLVFCASVRSVPSAHYSPSPLRRSFVARFTGILGILVVLAAAWLGSTDRRRIRWRTIAWGLGLQITFAFLVLRFDLGESVMRWAGGVVTRMLSATVAGTRIAFV